MEWTPLSYELFFVSAERPANEEFVAYFSARADYQIDRSQAWYENPDTGVSFSFDLVSPEDSEDLDFQGPDAWASFSLAFLRPHYFAAEAVSELEAFVERFESRAFDPNSEGVGDGKFSVDGFLRGYRHGNRAACRAMAALERVPAPIVRPSAELDRIWRWNLGLRELRARIAPKVRAPRIGFYRSGGRLFSAAVWKDAEPILLPQVELVIVEREALAPRRFFVRRPGVALMPWNELAPRLASFPSADVPLPHHRLVYATSPLDLVELVRGLPSANPPESVPTHGVLSEELFDASRPSYAGSGA